MKELNGIGAQSLPSILKDPFSKVCVSWVSVFYSPNFFSDKWEAHGTVEFKNGNTKGEQSFKAETFDECTAQIREFIKSL